MTVYNPAGCIGLIIGAIILFYFIVYVAIPVLIIAVIVAVTSGSTYGVVMSCYNFVCACRDHLFKRTTIQ